MPGGSAHCGPWSASGGDSGHTVPRSRLSVKQELELLQSIAGVIALGLYASHRAEVERFRLGELNLVRRVSAEIATVLPLDELSRARMQPHPGDVQVLLRGDFHACTRVTAGCGSVRAPAPDMWDRGGRRWVSMWSLGQGLIGEAAASGQIVQADDVREAARYRYFEPLRATRSEVVIPVKLQERVLGVLDVQSDRVAAFHRNDLMLLEALADNVARAVEGARLYGDVRRRADQLALLADVSRRVTSTLELHEVMAEAACVDTRPDRFPTRGIVHGPSNRRLIEYEAGSGTRAEALRGYSMSLDDPRGIIPWAARTGKGRAGERCHPGRYGIVPRPWRPTKHAIGACGARSCSARRTLGILDIQSEKAECVSRDDDRLMFEAVAGTIAASIRNADLYRSEQWRRQAADSLREVAGRLVRTHRDRQGA